MVRKETYRMVISLFATMALALAACSKTETPSETPITVKIGYLNISASLPLFIAEDMGFLTQDGVKFESIPFQTSNQLVDGIAAGNLDAFIESSAVPVLALELQSPGRLKIFATSSITKDEPFDAILVKADSSLTSLSDLARKKIGVFPGSTATTLLKKYLSDNGIDVSGITFIPVPPQNQLTALIEGSIDALHCYEPTIAIGLTKGNAKKLYGSVYADMLDRNPQGVAAVSTKFTQEHPQTAQRVVHALEQGMIFMRDNELEARQIAGKRLGLDEAITKTTVFLYMHPHTQLDGNILQQYADMLSDLQELKGRVRVDSIIYR